MYHPIYLTSMESTSCEILHWMIHKLESRLPGKSISSFRYVDSTTLMAESEEELIKSLLRVKEESEKVGFFEFNTQIMNIMASGPITS